MPFFRKKSKSEKHPNMTNKPPSRPGTADSFFLPPRPPPPPATVPKRNDTTSPASFAYDNGYGSLDHRLIEEQQIPPHIRTTDQLADFIRSRRQDDNDRSSISSSHYSTGGSTFISSADSARYTTFSVQANPYELPRPGSQRSRMAPDSYVPPRPSVSYMLPRPGPHITRVTSNPMIAGLSRRYVSSPVVRVLPGTTRKHPYQGYWVSRGTMRKVPEAPDVNNCGKRKRKGKKTKSAAEKGQYVETSGWYDD